MRFTRKTIIVTAVMVLAVGSAGFYLWNRNNTSFSEDTNTNGGASQSVAEDGTKLKEDGTPITSTAPANSGASSSSPQKQPANVTITSQAQNGTTVSIRALVNQSNGTCRAVFEKVGQPNVERSAPVGFAPPSYYTCQGFDIDSSAFPAKGDWQLRVYFSSESAEGQSDIRTVGVN